VTTHLGTLRDIFLIPTILKYLAQYKRHSGRHSKQLHEQNNERYASSGSGSRRGRLDSSRHTRSASVAVRLRKRRKRAISFLHGTHQSWERTFLSHKNGQLYGP